MPIDSLITIGIFVALAVILLASAVKPFRKATTGRSNALVVTPIPSSQALTSSFLLLTVSDKGQHDGARTRHSSTRGDFER